MRNKPFFDLPLFARVTAKLRSEGHEIFSPCEADTAFHGVDISNATGDQAQAVSEHGFCIRRAMRADLLYIIDHADAVYVLPDSQDSAGVKVEVALARCLGLPVVDVDLAALELEEV